MWPIRRTTGRIRSLRHTLLLERWQARPRQNPLTRALQEYGRLQRTLFLLRYLATPAYRREIGRQLNRGETPPRPAPTRPIRPARQRPAAAPRRTDRRSSRPQPGRRGLTCWNTHYIADIIDQLRADGWTITDDQLAHLSPAR